jgi:hypothetical protein
MLQLYIGRKFTGVTVQPDSKYAGMWRIHLNARISDMVNFARAKDAAITWARPRGLGGEEIVRWYLRETAVGVL